MLGRPRLSDPGMVHLHQDMVPVDGPGQEVRECRALDELNVGLPSDLVVDHVAERERFAVHVQQCTRATYDQVIRPGRISEVQRGGHNHQYSHKFQSTMKTQPLPLPLEIKVNVDPDKLSPPRLANVLKNMHLQFQPCSSDLVPPRWIQDEPPNRIRLSTESHLP